MPIADSLMNILVCPKTKQPLGYAEQEAVERLNALIRVGEVSTVSGELVKEPVEALLTCQNGEVLYQIRDSIPILLADEAIPAAVLQ